MTSEQGVVSLRSMYLICANKTCLFAVSRGRLQGVQKGHLERTAMRTCSGNVILDLRWFQAGNLMVRRLESFAEATRSEMVGVVRERLAWYYGTMGLASVGSTLQLFPGN